ncbi:uncharacterized, partial [Tachysurus ichikawai]
MITGSLENTSEQKNGEDHRKSGEHEVWRTRQSRRTEKITGSLENTSEQENGEDHRKSGEHVRAGEQRG